MYGVKLLIQGGGGGVIGLICRLKKGAVSQGEVDVYLQTTDTHTHTTRTHTHACTQVRTHALTKKLQEMKESTQEKLV